MRLFLLVCGNMAFELGGIGPLPNSTIVREARRLATRNRRHLEALTHRVRALEDRLCAAPFPPRRGTKVRWMHVPKCGSTFFNAVFRHACPEAADDMYLGARGIRDGPLRVHDLVDYAKQQCPEHKFATGDLDTVKRWATHAPVRNSRLDDLVVTMFRAPNQRLLSSYNFGKHLWGSEMRGPGISSAKFIEWRSFVSTARSPREFAAAPGLGGCYAKMMEGCYCATRPDDHSADGGAPFSRPLTVACPYRWVTLDEHLVAKAAQRVSRLGFVGIQDLYNASVCLFHRTFGGTPHFSEFSLFNVGRTDDRKRHIPSRRDPHRFKLDDHHSVPRWDETALGDFVDVVDEVLWAAILSRFERDVEDATCL